MKDKSHHLPIYVAASLLVGPIQSQACGNLFGTITNLPAMEGSGFQVNGLNVLGQLTGYFFVAEEHGAHAFVYTGGTLTDVGTLGGNTSQAFAINSSGQVAGRADLSGDAESHAMLYNGSSLVDLGTLGGTSSGAWAMNDAGQTAGDSVRADGATEAFRSSGSSMVGLGTLGGDYSSAFALNNAGLAAGESLLASGDIHGFVSTGAGMTDVGTLGGHYSSAFAVNNAGATVGESTLSDGSIHGFMYVAGVLTDLGTLGGADSSAFKINEASQIIGVSRLAGDTETHAFLYTGGAMLDLGTLGGNTSFPTAINNSGQVVGESALADGSSHAFLFQRGSMVDLNSILPAGSGWELASAQFINDAGRVVGFGSYNGLSQWFILDLGSENHAPVAAAGANQTVDCQTEVILDGTQSSDADGDPLSFEWSSGLSVLGTNSILTASFPLGTNVVTLKVTDPCGLFSQTNVVVRVVDGTAPVVICPNAITVSANGNCQGAAPNLLPGLVATDNCTPTDALAISQSPAPGILFGLGQHLITVTVTDASGNRASCVTTFTVVDTTPPEFVSLPEPVTVCAGEGCQGVVPNFLTGVVARDGCTSGNALVLTQFPKAGTRVAKGVYLVTVTAKDAVGNAASSGVSLTVADTKAPTIVSISGPITISAGENCQGIVPNVLGSVVARDGCTPAEQLIKTQSPAAGTLVDSGRNYITVTVTDPAGNSATKNVCLMVVDRTPPVIQSWSVSPNVLAPPNHQMVPVTVSVSTSDNCDPSPVCKIVSITSNEHVSDGEIQITGKLTAKLAASRNGAGGGRVYTINLRCTDCSGNSSTATTTVTVPQGNSTGGGGRK